MHRIQLNQDIRPLSEFRANVASFIEQVNKTNRPLIVTNHGKGAVVVLGVEEYEALIDKIELLEEIRRGEKDIREGRVYTQAQAEKKLKKWLKKK